MKNENPISENSRSVLKYWILATRPKTWIASFSPVFVGTSIASLQTFIPTIFICTLFFALFIQIGTNFANDYFDFLKGADTDERKGPLRAVQQGWISPLAMQKAIFIVFITAFFFAIPLMIKAGFWSFPITLASIACGILYTGGPKPLGYLGLGEILVFLFFGPIATCGTYFLQTNSLNTVICIASLAPGFLSCAILIANNLRDEETDKKANKNTLVVRFGALFGAIEYTFCLIAAACIPLTLLFFYNGPTNLIAASALFIIAKSYIQRAFDFQNPNGLPSLLPVSALFLGLYTFFFCLAYLW